MSRKNSNAAAEDLPIVECIGIAQVPKGFVVVGVSIQGTKAVAQEILTDPEPRHVAVQRAQNELLSKYLKPKVGA